MVLVEMKVVIIDKKYNQKQQKFVTSILEGRTVAESARVAGVSTITAFAWLRSGMRDDIDLYRQEIFKDNIGKLKQGMELAVNTLFEILMDKKSSKTVKLNALKVIIDNNLKICEQEDIINRINILEQNYKENMNYGNK